ncbi:MAG: hypothetical protein KDA96_13270, partial [Planctomycetaceae bacterium]|nr:hypothetical protein [Planctomycetaceae bacterium]
ASSTTAGEIRLRGLGAITLTDVDTVNGLIDVQAAGAITATDVQSGGGAGDSVTLHTTSGNVTVGSVTSADTVTITADSGSIVDSADDAVADITAGGLITLTASANINGPGEGYLDLAAGSSVNASSTTAGEIRLRGLGAITLTDVDTVDGLIDVQAAGTITATDVQSMGATGDITLATTAGDIRVGVINASAGSRNVRLTSAGEITESVSDAAADIVADELQMTAATGIGSADVIEITVNTLIATNNTSGDIRVQETNTLIIGGTGVRTLLGNGNIDIDVDAGSLTVNSVVTAHGSGHVTLNADTGTVDLNANVSSTTGSIGVTGDVVTQDADLSTGGAGTVTVTADNGAITMNVGKSTTTGTGAIVYTTTNAATGDITVEDLTTTGPLIRIDAARNVLIGNGSGATLQATDGSATSNEQILVTAGRDIFVHTDSILSTDGNTAAGMSAQMTGDHITLLARGGAASVGNGLVAFGDNVVLRTDGGVATTFLQRPSPAGGTSQAFFNYPTDPIVGTLNLEGAQYKASFSLSVTQNTVLNAVSEENLRLDIDWRDSDQDGGMRIESKYLWPQDGTVTNPDPFHRVVQYQITHIYSIADIAGFVDAGNLNPLMDFSVSHHESIQVLGSHVSQGDTKLAADAAGGTNLLTLNDASRLVAGQKITVVDGNSPAESFTIVSIAANTLTLSGNLVSSFETTQGAIVSVDVTQTTVNSALADPSLGGSNQLTLTNPFGVSVGDLLTVSDSDSPAENFTVTNITGNVVTLNANLVNDMSPANSATVTVAIRAGLISSTDLPGTGTQGIGPFDDAADTGFQSNATVVDDVASDVDFHFESGRVRIPMLTPPFPPTASPTPSVTPEQAPPVVVASVPITPLDLQLTEFDEPVIESFTTLSEDIVVLRQLNGTELIDLQGYERIEEGATLLYPELLREWVARKGLSGSNYELWLITTKRDLNGDVIRVERPLLRFDVVKDRPFPASENPLPDDFPDLQLRRIDPEADSDADSDADPPSGSDSGAVPEGGSPDGGVSMIHRGSDDVSVTAAARPESSAVPDAVGEADDVAAGEASGSTSSDTTEGTGHNELTPVSASAMLGLAVTSALRRSQAKARPRLSTRLLSSVSQAFRVDGSHEAGPTER